MRKTKIAVVAIALMAILTTVLLLNTKVQNIVVKVLHHKELKSYKLLANNGIHSHSYEIKNIINGSLDGPIMFDTLHKVFVIGTKKVLSGKQELTTFWKVNTHGQVLDSLTVPDYFLLAEDGMITSKTQYLDWVHTDEKSVKTYAAESSSKDDMPQGKELQEDHHALLRVTADEMKHFPQVSLQRSYFLKRRQRNGDFLILGSDIPSKAKGYEGPAYFDLTYYGETMKFKAYDFESSDGPKSNLHLWSAPKGYESPHIHFLYLPDILHLHHYSEVGVYVIRPKGMPAADTIDEHINGFFETSSHGRNFALTETESSLKLNMKTFIPLSEVSSYNIQKVDGQNKLSITFTPKGTALFKAMTSRNVQMSIALVIQGRIASTSVVQTPILNGKIEMGTYDEEELEYIIELLDDQKD